MLSQNNSPDTSPSDLDFSKSDNSLIVFPDKTLPIEAAYHATVDVNPDEAAKVISISRKTGHPPEFVAANLEATKKAADIPDSQYFADIVKKYPQTAEFLGDPGNMAQGKDDIENLAKTEQLLKSSSYVDHLRAIFPFAWKAMIQNMKNTIGVVPGFLDPDAPMIPINKIAGSAFDLATRVGGGGDQSYRQFLKDQIGTVPYNLAKGTGEFIQSLTTGSNLALMAGMGLGEGVFSGFPKILSTVKALSGGAFAWMMAKDVPQIFKAGEEAYRRGDYGEVARLAPLGLGQSLMSIFAAKGGIEDISNIFSGQKSVAPTPVPVDGPTAYSELGKTIAESKLFTRAPDIHGDFLVNVVKGSSLENITVPAQAFDTYFQGKNLNPDEIARNLGVGDQLAEARGRGGDIQGSFPAWAREFAKTPHYEGLKNDIRFNQEALTPNEIDSLGQSVQAKVDATVQAAKTANPGWDESVQKVTDEFQRQLVDSKAYTPKDAAEHSKLTGKMIEGLAAMTGETDPAAYLEKHPIKIVGGKIEWAEGSLSQDGIPIMKDSVMGGQPLFQEGQDPTINPRASISFHPDKALISLRNADPSSFMHEMAHYWLKNFSDFISNGAPTEQHIADWNTLTKFLDIKEGQKDLTVEQQEKFAKAFERYLYEGKAPSDNLRSAFNKFRTWLSNIYRDPESLGVHLTDEVRGVMDRILASEEEIKFAEQQAGLGEVRDYSNLDLDPKIIKRLDALREEAHDSAFQELFHKQMEEVTKENQAKLTQESTNARMKAESEVQGSEVQQAIRSVATNLKGDVLENAQKFWLKEAPFDKLLSKQRVAFDAVADQYGYSSGDELAYKITQEPPVEKQVQDRVDQHMAQFADLKDTDKIKEAALAAVHNEKSTELMAREGAIFDDLVDQAKGRIVDQKLREQRSKLEAEAAKARAQQTVAGMPTSEARKFMPYFTAERNAAVRVKQALMEGDFAKAAEAKREQMLNHALVKEAYAFRQKYDKVLRFFDRFESRGQDLKNMPYGFIRGIDTLLSNHGLADPRTEDIATYKEVAKAMANTGEDPDEIAHRTGMVQDANGGWKPETLSEMVTRIQNDYRNIAIPDSAINGVPTDYRKMKVSDFLDLETAVRAISAVGRGYDNFLDENIKMDRKEAAARFRKDVEANLGKPYYESRMSGSKHDETAFDRTVDMFNNARGILTPSLVNLYSFCMHFGHGDPDSLAMNLIYRPFEHALNAEIKVKMDEIPKMEKITSSHFTPEEYAKQKAEKVFIPSLNRDYTLDQIQAFANNWGTTTGRDRATNLIDGGKMTEQNVKEMLSHVTKNMWDHAQAIWDHNDTHWPAILTLEEKANGVTPKKVTPAGIETPYGNYRGGYYPLKYDRSQSNEAIKTVDERNALYKTQSPTSAYTEHGFTESRVRNYGQPINLDTRVEYTHLDNVIHDLTHRQAVIDVSAFLRQRDTREAIINSLGRENYDTIMGHVKWIAADQGDYLNGLSDRLFQRLRLGGTVATLALRPASAPVFLFSNSITAIKKLGVLGFGHSIMDFLSNRDENIKFINDLIPAMAKRSTMMDRDFNDLDKSLQGNKQLLSRLLFLPHQKADQAIAYPLALHVYKENIGDFGKQKAADLAYEAVTAMAGDGSVLGQAMIQRGSPSQKIWAWFYSWAGAQFNTMWRDGKMAGLEYDKGNVGTALTVLATSAFYMVGLQAANEAFWKDLVFHNAKSGDQDEDKRNLRMALRLPGQALSYVPIIGPIAQYGINRATGGQSGLDLPAVQMLETATNPLWDWAREQYTGKEAPHFWEETAKSAAILTPYPQYINNIAFNFIDNINGESEATWRDLFTRKTKN